MNRRPQRISTKIPRITINPQLVNCFSTQTSKMSVFFPRFAELTPIFRLADEIDRATRHVSRHGHSPQHVATFAPKFDVKETKQAYELVGELPGIEQSNVNIEWADEHTLAISGKTGSRYETAANNKATEEAPKAVEAEVASDNSSEKYQQPSVEEDEDAVMVENSDATPAVETSADAEKPAHDTEEKGKAVAKPEDTKAACQQACRSKNGARYWVSERSVGSFQRTFTFPGRVDHDAVKAALKNGVLNITVPKAAPLQPKRVEVN
jgi:HSP20 family protein